MSVWPIDPKTSKPSVSLGILVIATAAMVVAIGLNLAGLAKGTELVTEFWMGSAGLYWGRKFTSTKGSTLEQTVEQVAEQVESGAK